MRSIPFDNVRKAKSFQKSFLSQVDMRPVYDLFNHLPGVLFLIQDANSRYMYGNDALLDRLGLEEERFIGTCDHDYFPEDIADSFACNDHKVIETGRPVLNCVETWYSEQKVLDWCISNKLPLRNDRGEVSGIAVTIRKYQGSSSTQPPPVSKLEKAVQYIRSNFNSRLRISEIAARAGVGERELRGHFHRVYGVNIRQFILSTRINEAAELLKSRNLHLAEIAFDSGFCDQSAFTKSFRQATGMTPLQYRKRHLEGLGRE